MFWCLYLVWCSFFLFSCSFAVLVFFWFVSFLCFYLETPTVRVSLSILAIWQCLPFLLLTCPVVVSAVVSAPVFSPCSFVLVATGCFCFFLLVAACCLVESCFRHGCAYFFYVLLKRVRVDSPKHAEQLASSPCPVVVVLAFCFFCMPVCLCCDVCTCTYGLRPCEYSILGDTAPGCISQLWLA